MLKDDFVQFLKRRPVINEVKSQTIDDCQLMSKLYSDDLNNMLSKEGKEKLKELEDIYVIEMGEREQLSYMAGVRDCGQLLKFLLNFSTNI